MFHDKKLKSVADAVMQVEGWMKKEELTGDQHKLDVNKNKKVDAQDLAMLRSGKKTKSMQEGENKQMKSDDPCWKGYEMVGMKDKNGKKVPNCVPVKENDEQDVAEGFEHGAKVGDTRKTQHGVETKTATGLVHKKTYKDEPEADEDEAPKAKKKGVFKRRYNTKMYKEQFSGLLDSYSNTGIKGLFEDLEYVETEEIIQEEATNDEFKKELDDAQSKSEGKKKADVAAASVQSVTSEEVEQVEERTLTEPEMKKREEIVKSMKKNLKGFKERYGERAKEVMYATATNTAKKSA